MSNRVITCAALGLTTSTFHPYFHEVNPIKPQSSFDTEKQRRKDMDERRYAERKRQRMIVAAGGRILPAIK